MKNKEIEELLNYLKNNTYIPDETKRKYKILHRDEVNLLLSYIEQLEEDNEDFKRLCETQNNREYRSKFLKEFQEEHGKNVFPDYDEIYERYDKLKKQKDDVVECCNKSIKSINEKLANNKEPFEVIDGKIIYLNDYQVVRLKAIRMKCKEILRMLGEKDE